MTTTGPGQAAEPAVQKAMGAISDLPTAQMPGADQVARTDGDGLRAELPAELASARQARSAVRQALAAWRMDHLCGDAELLASELVANAAEHGDGQPISLALRRHTEPGERPGITCEVTDTSPVMPPRRDPVAALAQSSGVRVTQAGKTTWFTLALTDRAHRAAAQIEHEPEAGA